MRPESSPRLLEALSVTALCYPRLSARTLLPFRMTGRILETESNLIFTS